jgi:hypothetical protein
MAFSSEGHARAPPKQRCVIVVIAVRNIDRQLRKSRIGVFVCGGDSLCATVEVSALAASAGSNSDNVFVFHKELFG